MTLIATNGLQVESSSYLSHTAPPWQGDVITVYPNAVVRVLASFQWEGADLPETIVWETGGEVSEKGLTVVTTNRERFLAPWAMLTVKPS